MLAARLVSAAFDTAVCKTLHYKIIKLSHWQQPAGTHVAVFDYEILKQRLGFRSSKQIKADIAELSSTFHLVKYEQ